MRHLKSGVVVIAVGLLWGVAQGCSSESDKNGSGTNAGTTGGAGGAAAGAWGDSACYGCVASACATEVSACNGDPTCAAHSNCLKGCGADAGGQVDSACAAGCPGASGSSAEQLISALDDCISQGASACSECGAGSGGAGGGGTGGSGGAAMCEPEILCAECAASQETNPCWKCQDENCCDTDEACRADPGCLEYFQCIQGCNGDLKSCVAQCDADVGAENFLAYNRKIACVLTKCATEDTCLDGPVDPCVGCMNERCAAARARCEMDEPCARLGFCVEDCTNQGCYDSCFAQFPAGVALIDGVAECGVLLCDDVCS